MELKPPIRGAFAPHGDGYFSDFRIEYSLEGVGGELREERVAQVSAQKSYRIGTFDPGSSRIRLSGSASGKSLGQSSQYTGSVLLELRVGDQKETRTIPIGLSTNPPYAFELSLPISEAVQSIEFSVRIGMHWPNGRFMIAVVGSSDASLYTARTLSDPIVSAPKNLLQRQLPVQRRAPLHLRHLWNPRP